MPALDLSADVVRLTASLIDVPSESHHEEHLADLVEQALMQCDHLTVVRLGNTIVAMTHLGRPERVLIGGHLDTVPSAGNLPHSLDGDLLYGLGACDMKGGVAVALKLAHGVVEPTRDVTYVFYEGEEVASEFNGLQHLADQRPELLEADLAILMEPSDAGIEAGCQGTLRVEVAINGVRSHSARSWMGVNAVHGAAEVLTRLGDYSPARPVVDGLEYREGLNAVGIRGGIAGNVIPDACVVTVNYRFAPDKTLGQAIAHVRAVFDGYEVNVVDEAPAARPGLDRPAARDFVAAVGSTPRPKFGWTDVARFAALGVPALNFGPGDPSLAHAANEHVSIAQLRSCLARLEGWLTGQ
ncbi:MAG: succinyl-diaminopimelate desuccinylase [Actinobacteria bacterium]|nr:succinyl-diaminopimelate desuccinylase [Actinomycetota bacterium]